MDPVTLGLTAVAMGGQVISGIGNKNATAKQGRLQMMEDERIRQINADTLVETNARRERLARELLTLSETNTVTNNSWQSSRGTVNVDEFMAAGERAGFNPVTWLQSGALSLFAETLTENGGDIITRSEGHNAAEAFKMMMPEYSLAQPSQIPVQSNMLQAFGGGLTAGANTFGTQYRANQQYDLGMQKIMAAQSLQGMGLGNANPMQLVTSGGATRSGFPTAGAAVGGLTLSNPGGGGGKKDMVWPSMPTSPDQLWESEPTKSGNPFPPSWGWVTPPGFAQTSSWEDWGGEAVSLPYGLWKLYNTAMYNMTGDTYPGHVGTVVNKVRNAFQNPFATKPNMTRYSGTGFANGSASP